MRCALDLGSHGDEFATALADRKTVGWLVRADLGHGFARLARGPAVVADEEFLPFAPNSFDLVVSAMDLHWVNDLPGTLVQIARILRPDGLLLGAMLGGATLWQLRQALTAAESEVEGGLSPRVSPFADLRDAAGLLQRAGFALPVADSETIEVEYDNALALMRDLGAMGESNLVVERRRGLARRATLLRAAEIYGERFALPSGRVAASFEVLFLHGWAPHESQPKPLRPGSAAQRLADALGTAEQSAGEKAGARLDRATEIVQRSAVGELRLLLRQPPAVLRPRHHSLDPVRSPSASSADCSPIDSPLAALVEKAIDVVPTAMFMVAWQRLVLLGPHRIDRLPGLGWSSRETAWLGHLLKVAGMTFVLMAVFMITVGPMDPRTLRARRRHRSRHWPGARRWPAARLRIHRVDAAGAARELRPGGHRRRRPLLAAPFLGPQPGQRLAHHRRPVRRLFRRRLRHRRGDC